MKKGKLTIRLDDITPDMHWENFWKLDAVFEKYGIFPLLGVVPDNCDETLKVSAINVDFWMVLKRLQEKGYAIAQHGYQHVYETENSGLLGLNPFSEFAGLPFEKQNEKIKNGKKILAEHEIVTDIFMAPGHTYDKNTLKALQFHKFQYVTDGYGGSPYKRESLKFIPCSKSGPEMTDKIDTICIHLNYMSADEIQTLDLFMQQNFTNMIGYKQLLDYLEFPQRTLWIGYAERKALAIHNIKDIMANSVYAQKYMRISQSDKKIIKIVKRVLYSPMLFLVLKDRKQKSIVNKE